MYMMQMIFIFFSVFENKTLIIYFLCIIIILKMACDFLISFKKILNYISSDQLTVVLSDLTELLTFLEAANKMAQKRSKMAIRVL